MNRIENKKTGSAVARTNAQTRKTSRIARLAFLAALVAGLNFCVQPAQAEWWGTSAMDVNGGEYVRGKYVLSNNQWGKRLYDFGWGWQYIGTQTTNTNGYWKTDFEWRNKDGVAWEEEKIKAYPNTYIGWQWGWKSQNSDLPVQLSANKNIYVNWSYSINATNWKGDALIDIWIDPSANPSQHPTDEVMILLNYSPGIEPPANTNKYVETVSIDGVRWKVYRDYYPWNAFLLFRETQTTNVSGMNLRPILDYLSSTKGWIPRSKYVVGQSAGFEIWRGKGSIDTWNYSCNVM